ncbi:MAG: sulfatase-like hydrolase/transferase [Planctomycetaceae bacterium]|nr:sulfatase-like hydrolase/transferase [Planctomycetaceae bacterium]
MTRLVHFVAACIPLLLLSNGDSALGAASPNFVIIMADDLGYGDLSCYDGWIHTPSIDRLAAMGIRLTDYHSNGAVCSPTRAALMTGRYQQRCGIAGVVMADPARGWRERGLPLAEVTLPEALHDHGYQTAMFGKWHLGYNPTFNPVHHGFDAFRGYVSGNVDYFSHIDQAGFQDWWRNDQLEDDPGYSTHLINSYAAEFLRTVDDEKPFLLYVAHEAPHYPYQGPADNAFRTPGNGEVRQQLTDQEIHDAYRQMVQEVDSGLGRLLDVLRQRRLDQKTVVIFCSDNGGTANGSNGALRGFKGQLFEGGHRVPAVISYPGHLRAGQVLPHTVMTMDLMPTLLDLANIPMPERPLDGISLRTMLESSQPLPPRTLFWEFNDALAVRDGDWKLIRQPANRGNARQRNQQQPATQLFNLAQDPGEATDVAADHAEVVERLSLMLDEWRMQVELDGAAAMKDQLNPATDSTTKH